MFPVCGIILTARLILVLLFSSMKKIYLASACAAVVFILFVAPWFWIDNGENIIERDFRPTDPSHKIDETFFARPKIPARVTDRASTSGGCPLVRLSTLAVMIITIILFGVRNFIARAPSCPSIDFGAMFRYTIE